MPFVSVTRLRLRSWRFFPAFTAYTLASAWQVRRAPGFLSGYLAGDPDRGSWTVTLWRDEAAMKAFRGSGPHMRAMPRLLKWCDEAAIAHWTEEEAATAPTPEIAFEGMRRQGRLSKVHRPSPRHVTGQLVGSAAPRVGLTLRPLG